MAKKKSSSPKKKTTPKSKPAKPSSPKEKYQLDYDSEDAFAPELDAEELLAREYYAQRVGQLDLREFLYKDKHDKKTKVLKKRLNRRFFKEYTAARVAASTLPLAESGWRKNREVFDLQAV